VVVTPGFFETLGARLLAGRFFSADRPGDVDRNYRPDLLNSPHPVPYGIIVNRAGARALGFADPAALVGRSFATPGDATRTVVGVVDDLRFNGAHDPVPPTMYEVLLRSPAAPVGILRYTGDAQPLRDAVRAVWLRTAPQVPLRLLTAAQSLRAYDAADERAARLFALGAVLAVVIGGVGLWGLASFNTARRLKEIGIRKTLGARAPDVLRLLLLSFLRPVLLANLVAWPLAYAAVRGWLAGFAEPVALSPWFFVLATLLATGVAAATVLAQAVRAAGAAPAWALRRD